MRIRIDYEVTTSGCKGAASLSMRPIDIREKGIVGKEQNIVPIISLEDNYRALLESIIYHLQLFRHDSRTR